MGFLEDMKRHAKRDLAGTVAEVYRNHARRPVSEVKDILANEGFTDPELTQIAIAISEGREPLVA